MEVEISSRFRKKAKKLSSDEKKELIKRTEWFEANPQDPRLKSHALTGRMKGSYAFSVSHGKRVVYTPVSKETVVFLDVGPHDEVYRK